MKKWKKKAAAVLCLVCAAIMWHTDTASAQPLEAGKTFKIDLDGNGTKESIKWTEQKKNDKVTVKLYVNGKKLATMSSEYGIYSEVSVVDISKKDKYKEIYVQINSDSDCFAKGFGYRYQSKKLKKSFTFDTPAASRLSILEKQPGDGNVWFNSEYADSYVMQGYAKQAYKISSGKLKPVNKTVMNTTDEWRKMGYKSTKTLDVYTNIGDETPAFTLSTDDIFHIYKIKSVDYKTLYTGISYIYVKTDSGKTGWIKNPKEESFLGRYDSNDEWIPSAYFWG